MKPFYSTITYFIIWINMLFIWGCASPVDKYFHPVTSNVGSYPKTCTAPEIRAVRKSSGGLQKSLRDRWVEVGYSSWNGEDDDIQDAIIKKSKLIDACLVLVYTKQTGSELEEMPVDGYMGSPFYGGYYGAYYGGFDSYMPYSVPLYQYDIYFLAQMRVFHTGLYIADLDNAARKLIDSNKGVIVTLVVNNSPAYNADIIPGDIITKIGKYNLTNDESFDNAVDFYQGESATFIVNRSGKKLSKNLMIK
jgi:hypothetical protein